jgi:hypothetical protein
VINRRLHKWIGLLLLAPVLAWATTGVFFLVRPAFEEAYSALQVKSYPLTAPLEIAIGEQWLEYRYLETVLGRHLLVRTTAGWTHLNAQTGAQFNEPAADVLAVLVSDAISINPSRYGEIAASNANSFVTSTGVDIEVFWQSLSLSQMGNDTRWINQVYDIHYLRWTGVDWLDEVLGLIGLVLLILMTATGAKLLLSSFRR